MPVVKEPRVPQLVPTSSSFVEVEVIAVVEHVQAISHILARMRVDYVEQDGDAHPVRSINKLLQLVWKTVTRRASEEGIDLIAEGSVVGVLHDGHELDGVVAKISNARERVLCKLLIGRNLRLWTRDTDMRFVDASTLWLWRSRVLPLVFVRWIPESSIVYRGDR